VHLLPPIHLELSTERILLFFFLVPSHQSQGLIHFGCVVVKVTVKFVITGFICFLSSIFLK
jgi:hypothetical protein